MHSKSVLMIKCIVAESSCFPPLHLSHTQQTAKHTFIDQGDVHITLPPPRAGLPRLAHLYHRLDTTPGSSATAGCTLPLLAWL